MLFITIDGDDVGQKISACYLNNDVDSLISLNNFVQTTVKMVADYLISKGFTVIFCAADGVAAYNNAMDNDLLEIYKQISTFSGGRLTFSAGTGSSLRESYFALSFAKSNGKARICHFWEMT